VTVAGVPGVDAEAAARWRAQGHWPGVVLTDGLFEWARRDPERELVVDPVFGRFTYGRIAEQVERLAHGLRAIGIGPGDVGIIELPNWAPFLVTHLALTAVGAITVNIPPIYREREVDYLLRFTGARLLVIPGEFRGYDFLPLARAIAQGFPRVSLFLAGPGSDRAEAGMLSFEEFLRTPWEARGHGADLEKLRPDPDDVTAIGFTSGTTGVLKGALQTSNILSAINRGLIRRYGLDANERILLASPAGHAVGFTHCLRMAVAIGATLVLLDRWDPGRAIELIARERCTFTAAATPFLIDIVGEPALRRHGGLPSLRLFLCGGAPVPAQLAQAAREALPHTFTSPLFGMTECGGVTTCPFDAPREKLWTTDGLPCEGMELRVVDRDGAPLPPGADGELLVRGPMVALGYLDQPGLTREHFLLDGFFRTGDQARLDADGYVKITGRIKDLIIRGGVNLSPVEIEDILFAHPHVANVAVVGMPDPRLGERVCAFIVPKPGASLTLGEAQAWMERAGVAKQKWPERIELVESFPVTPSGKVQKFRLRELIGERVAAEAKGITHTRMTHERGA
jgi:glutaryl-CoA dehydrogenase/cyclohexanecarboxylate-CoA ligase